MPCSTGEEPYSIAATLLDAGFGAESFRVEAVDVSRRAVETATGGVYSASAFREAEHGPDVRYFERTGNRWTVRDKVRQAVGFRVANVMDPGFLTGVQPFDAVFCRNLLIYLTPDARRRVANVIDRLLAPGGVVYLGHAEPFGMIDPRYHSVGLPQAFAFARVEKVAASVLTSLPEVPLPVRPALISWKSGLQEALLPSSPQEESQRQPLPSVPDPSLFAQKAKDHNIGVADHSLASADPLHASRLAADRGDVAGAIALAEQYLRDHPPSAAAFTLIGALHATAGHLVDAERAFTRALYLDPGHYDALVHLMVLAENRGDTAAAANYRRRAARREGVQ
jgi:chemotaxis protein methyltransferase WspC